MEAKRPKATMDMQVESLLNTWRESLHHFDESEAFTGPSVHFHRRAIESRARRHAADLCRDEHWLELLYATLTAWGMHRMGPRGAKLVDFKSFCRGFGAVADSVADLSSLRIWAISPDDDVVDRLWSLVRRISVSASETQLVAGSKAVHHLLPDLVPPIDRQYTLRFFLGYKPADLPSKPGLFADLFKAFVRIARDRRSGIAEWQAGANPMDTSPTKRIDNAIVGFVRLSSTASASDANTEGE